MILQLKHKSPQAFSDSTAIVPVAPSTEEEEAATGVEKILSSTRPRDVFDGVGSGLKVGAAPKTKHTKISEVLSTTPPFGGP